MIKEELAEGISLYSADCREVLRSLPDASIDSVVTDPPYALNFMGKAWDTGAVAFAVEFWAEVFRVLKPGGHVVAFSGTRTYHRMAVAIEDAGFEIRDQLQWVYGSGFPKSHDVSKGIDRAAQAEREVIGHRQCHDPRAWFAQDERNDGIVAVTKPATPAARQWQGWGTALKPAHEPICLARKPLGESTVAANVLRWGTGAINVDGCRIATDEVKQADSLRNGGIWNSDGISGARHNGSGTSNNLGRWPANLCHDGSEEVLAGFPNARSAGNYPSNSVSTNGMFGKRTQGDHYLYSDSGSAARFFYSAKASKADRAGSKHPTVKPIALMQWLARLITPPGGTLLDPFAGSGTTGAAAHREGFKAILCERETEYAADIRSRFLVKHMPERQQMELIA